MRLAFRNTALYGEDYKYIINNRGEIVSSYHDILFDTVLVQSVIMT